MNHALFIMSIADFVVDPVDKADSASAESPSVDTRKASAHFEVPKLDCRCLISSFNQLCVVPQWSTIVSAAEVPNFG